MLQHIENDQKPTAASCIFSTFCQLAKTLVLFLVIFLLIAGQIFSISLKAGTEMIFPEMKETVSRNWLEKLSNVHLTLASTSFRVNLVNLLTL